ncbi:MAG: CRISPR-associated DxTHG motif protein [Campylobacter sp.]|nr:CRISPR-associated DxTHG motif protein [Campylobacter sp.]
MNSKINDKKYEKIIIDVSHGFRHLPILATKFYNKKYFLPVLALHQILKASIINKDLKAKLGANMVLFTKAAKGAVNEQLYSFYSKLGEARNKLAHANSGKEIERIRDKITSFLAINLMHIEVAKATVCDFIAFVKIAYKTALIFLAQSFLSQKAFL